MKCQVLVDWLTFSVKSYTDPAKVIRDYLALDPALFQEAAFGLNGYSRALTFNNILVLYDPREDENFHDMGVCVSMSGNGCRTFENYSKLGDRNKASSEAFSLLFQLLAQDENVNISRIDIACDDKAGYLDMDEIINKTRDNAINSRMTKRSVVVSYDGTQRSGSTVYIGSEKSDFRIRIYDKALEQCQDGHWIRFEMVMRGKNATSFVQQAAGTDNIGTLTAEVINDKFAFIERDDKNISRCTISAWWQEFVDELNAVKIFTREAVQHSVDRIHNWITEQVGPSLAVLFKTLGFAQIMEIAYQSQKRLSDKQRSLIEDYNSYKIAALT